jgi:hypothetical protein
VAAVLTALNSGCDGLTTAAAAARLATADPNRLPAPLAAGPSVPTDPQSADLRAPGLGRDRRADRPRVDALVILAVVLLNAGDRLRPGRACRGRWPDELILSGELIWAESCSSRSWLPRWCSVCSCWPSSAGLPLATARTIAVNALVAIEIGYLFRIRYVHETSLT